MICAIEVKEGTAGLAEYVKAGGWDSLEDWEVDFGLSREDGDIGNWFETGEDFEEFFENDVSTTTRGRLGFNIGQRWFVEEAELLVLENGRTVITLEEHQRVS